jgi:hypothetical protein
MEVCATAAVYKAQDKLMKISTRRNHLRWLL